MRFLRRHLFRAVSFTVLCVVVRVVAQELSVRNGGDQLHISAPKLHFLSGKPLQRLQNGNTVAYDFQLSVLGESKTAVLRRNFERFVFSYDLWEERFSVTRMRSTQSSAAHLTSSNAEAWCLDNMAFPSTGLPFDQLVWVRLEVRAQEPKEPQPVPGEQGISIASLIEIFGRASKTKQPQYWKLEAGPLKLADLRTAGGRSAD
ncbi:MAG: hypothetical protein ABJF23_22130 [Bryobacteraceae bacterium]